MKKKPKPYKTKSYKAKQKKIKEYSVSLDMNLVRELYDPEFLTAHNRKCIDNWVPPEGSIAESELDEDFVLEPKVNPYKQKTLI